jgi:protein-tyrosine phosphatase
VRRVRVLVVCMGNICRSPTAEAVLRERLAEAGLGHVEVDSAGTGGWHVGDRADSRARAEAARNGITIDGIARQLHTDDYYEFDLLLTVDAEVHQEVANRAPDDATAEIRLLREFDTATEPDDLDVPDPYYGGPESFRNVFMMIDAASRGVVEHIRTR